MSWPVLDHVVPSWTYTFILKVMFTWNAQFTVHDRWTTLLPIGTKAVILPKYFDRVARIDLHSPRALSPRKFSLTDSGGPFRLHSPHQLCDWRLLITYQIISRWIKARPRQAKPPSALSHKPHSGWTHRSLVSSFCTKISVIFWNYRK